MAKYLVIVESPAKVKTIKKFLGSSYEVDASGGHVRDLPKSQLGIDVEHDYEPRYITIRGKGDVLAKLRKEVKKADVIYLATDPDREGEAISWHLMKALKLDEVEGKKVYRISFNEITKNAVKASLKEPRQLDMSLVDAQQTRRILDRMVGYRISPLLWAKVKRGLSAGRVQSAALRMICDREEEIEAFIPEEYWELEADLLDTPASADTLAATAAKKGKKNPLTARFYGDGKGRMELTSEEDVQRVLTALKDCRYVVDEVKKGERIKKAPLPFTTSTLQQEASKILNFSTQKTMRLAQQLYEGVTVKGHGTIGLITYLRTDSTRVAEEAAASARAYIGETYGAEYAAGEDSRTKSKGANIQDAHEAIRPTDIRLTPAQVKDSLERDQYRLYQLIWKRFTASRMTSAIYGTVAVKVKAGAYYFSLSASRRVFDGYLCVGMDDEEEDTGLSLENLTEGKELKLSQLRESQHFTQPPAHFTEASLVKALEEEGIGRPSTYAPTITTLLGRRYVAKENKNLYVTELGEVVNRIMKENFPSIVDVKFTANMEYLLDSVGDGSVDWKTVVRNFYPDLDAAVKAAEKDQQSVTIGDEVSDEVCELCGRQMVIKYGPHGKFLACPGFPECKNTKPYLEKIGVPCPKCGGELVEKKTRKGRRYYGCANSPECDFMSWQKPSTVSCPKCGSYMVEKGSRLLCSNETCGYSMAAKEV